MSANARLDRIVGALSGRERAILFLQEYKADTSSDPNAVQLPTSEHRVFKRLIDIIRFVNGDLADLVLIVQEQVVQETLRVSWLQSYRIYADDLWMMGMYIDDCVPVAVTESEFRKRKGKAPPSGYDVRSDDDADEVALLRKNRALIEKLVARGGRLDLPLDMFRELPREPSGVVDTARMVAGSGWEAITSYWTQLNAVQAVIAEYAEAEFDGEDPLRPAMRDYLDKALATIIEVRDEMRVFIGDWDLPSDYSASLANLRALERRVLG